MPSGAGDAADAVARILGAGGIVVTAQRVRGLDLPDDDYVIDLEAVGHVPGLDTVSGDLRVTWRADVCYGVRDADAPPHDAPRTLTHDPAEAASALAERWRRDHRPEPRRRRRPEPAAAPPSDDADDGRPASPGS